MDVPKMLTVKDAHKFILEHHPESRISLHCLRVLLRENKIPSVIIGKNRRLVNISHITSYFNGTLKQDNAERVDTVNDIKKMAYTARYAELTSPLPLLGQIYKNSQGLSTIGKQKRGNKDVNFS